MLYNECDQEKVYELMSDEDEIGSSSEYLSSTLTSSDIIDPSDEDLVEEEATRKMYGEDSENSAECCVLKCNLKITKELALQHR